MAMLQSLIEQAAEHAAPGQHMRMPSGAGHDARTISQILPASMMFIPSIGGVSHHYTENSSDEDIVLGARVLWMRSCAYYKVNLNCTKYGQSNVKC